MRQANWWRRLGRLRTRSRGFWFDRGLYWLAVVYMLIVSRLSPNDLAGPPEKHFMCDNTITLWILHSRNFPYSREIKNNPCSALWLTEARRVIFGLSRGELLPRLILDFEKAG
jgi:hypothetical protein